MTSKASSLGDLLAAVDASAQDRLVPLRDCPMVVEELTGRRPHISAVQRWSSKGVAGQQLQTVTVGRGRHTTRRWLLKFFADTDAARRSGEATRATAAAAETLRTLHTDARREQDEQILRRHGLGGQDAI